MYRLLIVILAVSFTAVVFAGELSLSTIKSNLSPMLSPKQLEALKVQPSAIQGLLEAELGTEVFYISQDGRHIILGNLLDTKTQVNLTKTRRQSVVGALLGVLPEKNMIVMGQADAAHTITVFTDVDCVFCRRLHVEGTPILTKRGVKVRYILFPRSGPGTESYKRSVAVWCASDRILALDDAEAGKAITIMTCANPIDANQALAEKLGVMGTPAIFLDNGKQLAGYLPASELLAALGLGK